MNSLDEFRAELDRLDEEIVSFISTRISTAARAIALKKSLGKEILDRERESEIFSRLAETSGLDKSFISKIFSRIIARGKLQENINPTNKMIIAGPCSIESEEQIMRLAEEISSYGIEYLRGGAFKPRTNPHSFQGLGEDGLKYIRTAADKYNMKVVSEFVACSHIDSFYELVDIIQVGCRNMTNFEFLKALGDATNEDKKPILLKRGFSATLTELLYAAEYIMERGNPNVILCLRGIRTFEQADSDMRFTPDLASILELKSKTNLKVIFDPSHSAGEAKYVVDIAKAALTLGADGLLVETHYAPEEALTDGFQAVKPNQLKEILDF